MFEGEGGPGLEDDNPHLQWQAVSDGRYIAKEADVVAGDVVLRHSGARSALAPSFASPPLRKITTEI